MTDRQHLALVLRTLQIEEELWNRIEQEFAIVCRDDRSLSERLRALKRIWALHSPHEASIEKKRGLNSACPVCSDGTVRVAVVREQFGAGPLIYGSCNRCGLGVLLNESAADAIYSRPEYYESRDARGAGYEDYAADREYREAKGRRLIDWITAQTARPLQTFLEVGSGFGFTRAAAEQAGMESAGVDRNPHAADCARKIYGQKTFTGTLEEAIDSRGLDRGGYDLVCYQFLLEHIADPARELELAASMLSNSGVLALIVPNMQSYEREIFGGAYRSFRHDHLWLFSPQSLRTILDKVGLKVFAMDSECNIRLLRGFLSEKEFDLLDKGCLSADLRVIADRK